MAVQRRADIGEIGEEVALAEYRKRGYRLLARNWRCSLGEVDVIVSRGDLVVFCAVKTRRGAASGGPHDAVTWRKQRKLRQLAEMFLAATGLKSAAVRFDVASVMVTAERRASVHLFESAF